MMKMKGEELNRGMVKEGKAYEKEEEVRAREMTNDKGEARREEKQNELYEDVTTYSVVFCAT